MYTVAQLRAFPHSKKLSKSGRQRASFLNRSSRVEEVAFCPPCSLGSSNKCTLVPALCRGLVLSLMYKGEKSTREDDCSCRNSTSFNSTRPHTSCSRLEKPPQARFTVLKSSQCPAPWFVSCSLL